MAYIYSLNTAADFADQIGQDGGNYRFISIFVSLSLTFWPCLSLSLLVPVCLFLSLWVSLSFCLFLSLLCLSLSFLARLFLFYPNETIWNCSSLVAPTSVRTKVDFSDDWISGPTLYFRSLTHLYAVYYENWTELLGHRVYFRSVAETIKGETMGHWKDGFLYESTNR